jgi:hypothetical protein
MLLTTELFAPTVLVITSRHTPHKKYPVYSSNSIVTCVFIVAGTCLPSRCPETVVVYSHRLATGLYALIFTTLRLKPYTIWGTITGVSYRELASVRTSLSQDNRSLGRDLNLVPTEYQEIILASSFVKMSYDSRDIGRELLLPSSIKCSFSLQRSRHLDTDKDTALVGEITNVDKGNIVLGLLHGQYRL